MRVIINLDIRVEMEPTDYSAPAQQESSSFQPQRFLQTLFEAYLKVATQHNVNPLVSAPIIALVDIHPLVTTALGLSGKYSKEKFARDIYRLHSSGRHITESGARVSFPISRGVRCKTISTPTETGEQMRYYGIRFIETAQREKSSLGLDEALGCTVTPNGTKPRKPEVGVH